MSGQRVQEGILKPPHTHIHTLRRLKIEVFFFPTTHLSVGSVFFKGHLCWNTNMEVHVSLGKHVFVFVWAF